MMIIISSGLLLRLDFLSRYQPAETTSLTHHLNPAVGIEDLYNDCDRAIIPVKPKSAGEVKGSSPTISNTTAQATYSNMQVVIQPTSSSLSALRKGCDVQQRSIL
jgi:hypothetical protein